MLTRILLLMVKKSSEYNEENFYEHNLDWEPSHIDCVFCNLRESGHTDKSVHLRSNYLSSNKDHFLRSTRF